MVVVGSGLVEEEIEVVEIERVVAEIGMGVVEEVMGMEMVVEVMGMGVVVT